MTAAEGTALLFGGALVGYSLLVLAVLWVHGRRQSVKRHRENVRYVQMLRRNGVIR